MVALQAFLVVSLVFAFIHLIPGDPVLVVLGPESNPSPEVLEAVRSKLGLDQPIHVQYLLWLKGLSQLNFGNSLLNNRPVWDEVSERLPRTLELVLVAMLIAILVGVPAGIISALRRGKSTDQTITTLSAVGISTPVFVIGPLLVLLFGVKLDILPIAGYRPLSDGFWPHFERLILPAITLALGQMAIIARMTRSSMLDVLNQNYMVTAKGKGVKNNHVLIKHGLKNALIPVVTLVGIQIGALLGGAVLVENIYNWPGLSTLLFTSVNRRDYPMVQSVVLVIAVIFMLINLLADLLYGVLDPRIRSQRGAD
jgi:peptide/nickel transport system permease protein